MKEPLAAILLAFCASASLTTAPVLSAQPSQASGDELIREQRAVAVVTFRDGSSLTTSAEGGISDLVGLQPEEVVSLQLNFPVSAANQRIVVQSLDGGFASGTKNTVASDGTLNFTFQAGPSPGLNRILVINQGTSSILRFWVINTAQPTANPSQLH